MALLQPVFSGSIAIGGQAAAADYREMTSHSQHQDRAAAARSRCNPLTWPELQTIISTGDLHKLVRSEEQEQTYCKARSKVRFIFLRLLRSCVVVFVLNFQRYQVRIIYSPLFENSSTYNIWTTTLLHQ